MKAPELFIDKHTNTAILVRDAFTKALAVDIVENIDEISCGYSLLDDAIHFTIKRKSDGMRVLLPVMRDKLLDPEPSSVVKALKEDPEVFARLILFLA